MMCFLVFIIACGNINDTGFFDSSLPKTGRYPKVLAITPLLADWVKQVGGEKIDLESSGLSKREWNELMIAFDLKNKLI